MYLTLLFYSSFHIQENVVVLINNVFLTNPKIVFTLTRRQYRFQICLNFKSNSSLLPPTKDSSFFTFSIHLIIAADAASFPSKNDEVANSNFVADWWHQSEAWRRKRRESSNKELKTKWSGIICLWNFSPNHSSLSHHSYAPFYLFIFPSKHFSLCTIHRYGCIVCVTRGG
jgi:hypothetical protein